MSNPLVELKKVSRDYDGGHVVALREVSLAVMPGEFLAVVGPSGSGKSTLLHLMSGLDVPTDGHVLFEGRTPTTGWSRIRAQRIGFIFQDYNLLGTLTALENIQIPMLGVLAGATRREQRARELLERVGLKDRQHHRPAKLSGGERQRVAIARGLANVPDLILADEPTGNLDSATSAEILSLLAGIRAEQGTALVVVTHDRELAARAGRQVRLLDGRIVSEERREAAA
jgi:putative ABC transport system ATP-binding protein